MAIIATYPALPDTRILARSVWPASVYQRLKVVWPHPSDNLSVVQAVAMGDLAQVVAAARDFTPVQWALTFNTFGVLIITECVQRAELWG
jgi:hypothetical protein